MKRLSRVAAAATSAVAMSLGVSAGPVFAAVTGSPASGTPPASSPAQSAPETPTAKPSPTSRPAPTTKPAPTATSTTRPSSTSAAAVLTQPLHLAPMRSALCEDLGLAGFPQALLRIGYAAEADPLSPRRAAEEVVGERRPR